MKLNYNFDLSKFVNSKAGLWVSFIAKTTILFGVGLEIYSGESSLLLMIMLAFYLIDSLHDTLAQLKDIN